MATVKKLQFELIGSDGAPLRGDVYTAGAGDRRPLVVVCHGFKGFKDWGFFPFLAQRLARAGMTAVSFNFSGSGVGEDGESFSEPQRFARNTYSRALRDLEIVRNAVQGGNLVNGLPAAQSCGLLGHSFGGAVSILFAAENSDVRALVTWAAVANPLRWDEQTVAQWREEGTIDIVNARTGEILPLYLDMIEDIEARGVNAVIQSAAQVTAPWLIIHGAADESVAASEGRLLYDSAERRFAELSIIPGAGHTFGARHPWAGYTPELEQAMDQTVAWFTGYLR